LSVDVSSRTLSAVKSVTDQPHFTVTENPALSGFTTASTRSRFQHAAHRMPDAPSSVRNSPIKQITLSCICLYSVSSWSSSSAAAVGAGIRLQKSSLSLLDILMHLVDIGPLFPAVMIVVTSRAPATVGSNLRNSPARYVETHEFSLISDTSGIQYHSSVSADVAPPGLSSTRLKQLTILLIALSV
jgi:hypothetical protein